MIRRFIGSSDILISVLGLDAAALLAAEDPQATLDVAVEAGIDWLDLPLTVEVAQVLPLLNACARPPRCLIEAGDVDEWSRRAAAIPPQLRLGGRLEQEPSAWPQENGLLVLTVPTSLPAVQALICDYSLFDEAPRENGLLAACFENGIGAISRSPWAGLDHCPPGIALEQWEMAQARLEVLAESAETDRRGLAIAVLQATPGMSACLVAVSSAQEAAALADYGPPATTKSIEKTLRCLAAMREGQLRPPEA
jgi:hypothetical protein